MTSCSTSTSTCSSKVQVFFKRVQAQQLILLPVLSRRLFLILSMAQEATSAASVLASGFRVASDRAMAAHTTADPSTDSVVLYTLKDVAYMYTYSPAV